MSVMQWIADAGDIQPAEANSGFSPTAQIANRSPSAHLTYADSRLECANGGCA